MRYTELLRNNSAFRMIWLGKVVSLLGDWMSYIAVLGLVIDLTGSGIVLALVMITRALPITVFGMISGIFLDRLDRKKILIYSDIIRAVLAIGYLFVNSADNIWIVYLLGGAMQSLTAFFNPGSNAVIPSICKDEERIAANSLLEATTGATMIIGSALGGLILAATGREWAFLINAISFVISAICILTVRIPHLETNGKMPTPYQQFREGIEFICSKTVVWGIIVRRMVERLGAGFNILLSIYAVQIWKSGEKGIGILYSITGIGLILGSWVVKKINQSQDMRKTERIIGWGNVGEAIFWIAFTFSPNLWIGSVMLMLMVACDIMTNISEITALQRIVPTNLLGRVFAARETLLTLAWGVALSITGVILESIGPFKTSAGIGGIMFLAACFWFILFRVKIRGQKNQLVLDKINKSI